LLSWMTPFGGKAAMSVPWYVQRRKWCVVKSDLIPTFVTVLADRSNPFFIGSATNEQISRSLCGGTANRGTLRLAACRADAVGTIARETAKTAPSRRRGRIV